jgi:hypothetical protein
MEFMKYLYFTLVLPINVFFFGDFTAFFAADFLAAGVFAAEDLLSNKKGCWQPGLSSVLSVTECLVILWICCSRVRLKYNELEF